MVRLLVVLMLTAAGSLVPALAAPTAEAGTAMCGGAVVTIDLNQPGAPDPERDARDVVLGTPGGDRIETGAGADVVCAGAGGDVVRGGRGNDTLYGEAGADLIDGAAGFDHLYGNAGADTLRGGRLQDDLYPGGGAPSGRRDRSYGGADIDLLHSSSGNDLLAGGSGPDVVLYDLVSDATEGVIVDLMVAGRQDTGAGGLDEIVDITNLDGGAGDDILSGDRRRNRIHSGGGADVLKGRDGNDVLEGGAVARGGKGTDWIAGAERAYGGPGADQLTSSAADQVLVGGPGSDTVRFPGDGCRCTDPADGVMIDLALDGPQDTQSAGWDEVVGIENVLTARGDDVVSGNSASNRLESQSGDDILNGREGTDWLDGGSDHDTCNGGPGHDHIEDCE
ncbi:calcium-binding protein [Nocardioides sp. MH1]|uniref:calcium-binding protein n=1 Tax=Nocardioides sp. MH1 TaxID=3242490 RepID=UPI003520730A